VSKGPHQIEAPSIQPYADQTLLSIRAAVVFLYALLASGSVGGLAILGGQAKPTAITAALAAFGGALPLANKLIGR
jgi:hypothetical protein